MPTIKRKVEMNLPQLIEWGFNNPELAKGRAYTIDDENARFAPYVSFLADGTGVRVPCTITQDNTFTIEIEEPVTEDTVFDKLICRYTFLSSMPSYAHAINESIKGVIEDRKKATHIYFENEDNELQLIWRDGRLIE